MKRLFILIIASACGIVLSQFPEFAQQYRQRLGGAVEELSLIVTRFDAAAANAGLSREQALGRYAQTQDDFLQTQGGNMQATITRYECLKTHLTNLTDAAQFERLWVFTKERDMDLSKATLDAYEPAVPATAEGLIYGGGGLAGGWILLSLLLSPFGRRRSKYR